MCLEYSYPGGSRLLIHPSGVEGTHNFLRNYANTDLIFQAKGGTRASPGTHFYPWNTQTNSYPGRNVSIKPNFKGIPWKNWDKILFRRPRRQNGGQSVESKSKKNLLLLVHSRHRALRTFSADRQTDDAVSVADMVSTDIICTVLWLMVLQYI